MSESSEPVATVAVETPVEAPKAPVLSLATIEEIINAHAAKIAARYGIRPDQFRINLHTSMRGLLAFRRGPVVQIDMLWPDVKSEINTIFKTTFKAISEKKLIDPLGIELASHIRDQRAQNRKWHREVFGDEGEILPDLLPKYRLRSTVKYEYTLEDQVSGLSVTIKYDDSHLRTGWDLQQEARHKLSRLVRDLEATVATAIEEEDEVDNG